MTQTKVNGYAAKEAKGQVQPFSYDMTPMKPDEILIKIACCGICHSDIHTIDAGWGPTNFPCLPGHEIIGTVIDKGNKATKYNVGDRVGVGAMVFACQECKMCKDGYDNLCSKRVMTYDGKYEDGSKTYGGYADYIKVHQKWAFDIPKQFTDEEAAPMLCAGATVYSPLKRLGVKRGMKVGIVGIGGLGHLAVQFANKMGAEVTCISTSPKKEQESKQLGASHFLNSKDESQMKKFASYFDVIINSSSGGAEHASMFLQLLAPNGTLCLLGIPESKMQLSAFEFVGQQRSITGSLVGSLGTIQEMLDFAAKNNVKPWIKVMNMKEVNDGIQMVRDNNVKYRVVLKN